MTLCNLEGITRSDKPTENYHLPLPFLSALQTSIVSFSSLFLFFEPASLMFYFTLTTLISCSYTHTFYSFQPKISGHLFTWNVI